LSGSEIRMDRCESRTRRAQHTRYVDRCWGEFIRDPGGLGILLSLWHRSRNTGRPWTLHLPVMSESPPEPTFRAFIAVELPPAARAFLVRVQEYLVKGGLEKELGREGRPVWSRPETLHLTLRFLGDITEKQAKQVAAAMDATGAAQAGFALRVAGIGGAPKPRAPRVLWAELQESAGLMALEAALSDRLEALGFARETRPWHPHLTLARVKWRKNPRTMSQYVTQLYEDAFNEAMREEKGVDFVPVFEVYTYSLFGSRLTPEGPIHTKRHETPLRALQREEDGSPGGPS
ncbi:MAG: RNA 2',3'-cyclic phosphodiesterase, partial [Chrysiogenetes bacterium]|nr:RNA 2',3'-cyclic phosphodiesterase [Chrysiogenetes bacterium]